jgi:hypothetical protein
LDSFTVLLHCPCFSLERVKTFCFRKKINRKQRSKEVILMAEKSFEVIGYRVDLGHRGTPLNSITCWGAEADHRFTIFFASDISSAPRNQGIIEPNKVIGHIYVPERQYAWYLDLLRNEGPIYAMVDDQRPDFANSLRTG